MTLKEKLQTYRNLILTLELSGLLHDTGKLSSEFITYRKGWQKKKGMTDPHDNKFFDNDLLLQSATVSALRDCLDKNISLYAGVKDIWINGLEVKTEISLKEIMHQHTKPVDEIAKFLKLGDSVDSAYDRNNPLMAMEQFDRDITFSSTVFGYETAAPVNSFDDRRKILYCSLNSLIPLYLKNYRPEERTAIFNAAEQAFKCALTDTCRPVNDITLWQHSYVTTALTKVFFLHFLIYGEKLQEIKAAKFALIGFGWDGMSFISKGHKIGDIVARKEIIKKLKGRVKEVIEYKYPIGMNVYDDDNGVYFIVPAIMEFAKEYKDLLVEINDEINQIADDITGGEIQPVVSDRVKNTSFIMEIVKSIDDVRSKSKYPHVSSTSKLSWMREWEKNDKSLVCSICQKRPVVSEKQNLCKVCRERRILAQKGRDINQSIFSSEIADKNRRLALVVARFSLEPWLKGDMIWTLFVKEGRSLKKALQHLEEIEDLKERDGERKKIIQKKFVTDEDGKNTKNFQYDYEKIKKQIDICLNQKDTDFAKAISFLFDRHGGEMKAPDWREFQKWIKDISEEEALDIKGRFGNSPDIYNFLLTKNHTPSRLLNVWNTTRDFLGEVLELDNLEAEDILLPFNRIKLIVDNPNRYLLQENAIYKAEINGKAIEIFRDGMDVFVVNRGYQNVDLEKIEKEWEKKKIKIITSEFDKDRGEVKELFVREILQDKGETYPFRIITTTPDTLMALVPADKAVDLSEHIYRQYKKHFGKVIGRLPFSIGNIFFPEKMPMFVVLDSGRRMLSNFENINLEYWNRQEEWEIKDDVQINEGVVTVNFKNNIQWQVNCSLGTESMDFFHPYLIVKDSEDNKHKKETSCFETFLGDLVHFTKIKKGYKVGVYPNYYDFEFLDSNTRRYDIKLDGSNRRKSNVADFRSKPFLLDELGQKIICLWSELLPGQQLKGITDTKLRNLQSLWLTKYQEWVREDNPGGMPAWKDLVACSIQKEFSIDNDSQLYVSLMETIENGLFFDTLELYLGILKERIDKK